MRLPGQPEEPSGPEPFQLCVSCQTLTELTRGDFRSAGFMCETCQREKRESKRNR